jgi:hypothetical protein
MDFNQNEWLEYTKIISLWHKYLEKSIPYISDYSCTYHEATKIGSALRSKNKQVARYRMITKI